MIVYDKSVGLIHPIMNDYDHNMQSSVSDA